MPYKISGTVEFPSRIIMLDETDYSIEESTVFSGSTYEFSDVTNSTKTVFARHLTTGQVVAYGSVTPTYVPPNTVDTYFDITVNGDDGYVRGTSLYNTNAAMEVGYTDRHSFMRFRSLTIPQGSTINSAYIRLIAQNYDEHSQNMRWEADDVDNSPVITSYSVWSSMTPTTATVAWNPSTQTAGQTKNSPELKTIVQEIIDRPGWASGNAIQFRLISLTNIYPKAFVTLEHATWAPARLYVNYDPA